MFAYPTQVQIDTLPFNRSQEAEPPVIPIGGPLFSPILSVKVRRFFLTFLPDFHSYTE